VRLVVPIGEGPPEVDEAGDDQHQKRQDERELDEGNTALG